LPFERLEVWQGVLWQVCDSYGGCFDFTVAFKRKLSPIIISVFFVSFSQ
jgi:hypothetical protein